MVREIHENELSKILELYLHLHEKSIYMLPLEIVEMSFM